MTNFGSGNLPILRLRRAFALLFGTCILLSSCGSSTKSVKLAQQNVEQFHSQLDSEQYAAIYAACDEKFHQNSSESDFGDGLRHLNWRCQSRFGYDFSLTGGA
jgi:hypothetical protein